MGGAINKKTHDTFTDPFKVIPDDKSDPIGLYPVMGDEIKAPVPPAPPPSAPTVADAQQRLRQQRASADEQARKKGRRSTIVTGDEGVSATPLARKTLVGS